MHGRVGWIPAWSLDAPYFFQASSLSTRDHPARGLALARFTLSFRDVEDLLAERGIDVSNETVRRWFPKFGRLIAVNLRRNRPRASARWHLEKLVVEIRGRKHWPWRVVDDEGEVLDFLVQPRRSARSARRLLRKLLKKQGLAPTRITTDKLKSYAVAILEERLSSVHDRGLRANDRAENSHQPVRRRVRKLQRFKSPESAQRFLSIHAAVANTFCVQCRLLSRRIFRAFRAEAFAVWIKVGSRSDADRDRASTTAAVNVSTPLVHLGLQAARAPAQQAEPSEGGGQ